jgi:hypothetical protein
MGNRYRTLLNDAFHSPQGWVAFRDAVLARGLPETTRWVKFWNRDLTAQTARRDTLPAHYATGALDPHIAIVRRFLEKRRWTFRNQNRMNLLLGLVRLHINNLDNHAKWAVALRGHLEKHTGPLPPANRGDTPTYLLDGSRVYTLRKHPVPPRADN